MISAGEASGDRLGAGLARAIRRLRPEVDLVGMGGREMEQAGVRIVQDASEVAVVGFFEVLSHLGDIRRAMKRLRSVLERESPDLLVPVDFPDFNLRLAGRAAEAGVPVVYFVSPQLWAWRRGRVRHIRRLVRRMLVLFPFEERFYREAGVPVTFVGHPVVERLEGSGRGGELLEGAGFDPARPVIALLPGSRMSEIRRLLPVMLDAAARLKGDRPELQFLVVRAGTIGREYLERAALASGVADLRVHDGDYPEILTGCAAGAVASGTATLESALAVMPMVVVYRMSPPSYLLGRMLVQVEHVGMVNLVAGRRVVPERIQGECTGENLARDLAAYLDDPGTVRSVRRDLAEVRVKLGGPGALERAAEAVLSELRTA
jgi:lipid-A-disaccharide synthase